jgi:hypothetical protein
MKNRELEPDEFAGTWSQREGYAFYIPVGYTHKTSVPERGQALIAAMIRLESDVEFREDCIEWLHKKSKKRS